jgi:Holliday junction resolvasome RuvABC endonuclease subunit
MTPRVLGIDLSLTGTGLAATEPNGIGVRTITTKKYGPALEDQWQRLLYIDAEIHRAVDAAPDLVLIEGPSYGSTGTGTWDRAGLWWLVVNGFLREDIPVAVVPPALVKKYATGKGNASKAAICSTAAKRYERVFATDDEADAFVLCAMGLDHLGHPLVMLPQLNRDALAKVQWPAVTL